MSMHNEIEFENEICEHLHAKGGLDLPKDAARFVRGFAGSTELHQGRRTAFIVAAGTGKIDVRNFAAKGTNV